MNLPNRVLIVLCILAVAVSVHGQDAEQGRNLVSVYDLATQQDPALKEAWQNLESAREARPQAKAVLLPNISIGGDAGYTNQDTVRPSELSGTKDFSDYALSLQLTQPIYRRDLWIQLDQTDNSIAQAEAVYARAEQELMGRVIEVYFTILAAQDDLTVSKAQTEANGRQLDQAKQRFDVGLIAITDVHEAQAAYDGSRADEIAAENRVDDAWESLFQIVGPYPKDIAKLGEELPLTPPEPANIESWATSAVQQNYSVIAAINAAEVARKNIELQRSGYYPTLDLQAGYGIDRTTSDRSSENDTGRISIDLNIPLYQGGGVSSRTRQAQYDYGAATIG